MIFKYNSEFEDFSSCLAIIATKSTAIASIGSMIAPYANTGIDTARIVLKNEDFTLEINPKFWNQLDLNGKAFVVAHEIVHILLNHISRGKELPQKIMNIAADAVTNFTLMHTLDFEIPASLEDQIVTFSSLNLSAISDSSMETVASHLEESACEQILSVIVWPRDHAFSDEKDKSSADKALRKILAHLPEHMVDQLYWTEVGQDIKGKRIAETSTAAAQSIINYFKRGRCGKTSGYADSWKREPRRLSGDLLLPDLEEDFPVQGAKIYIYMDSSGSMTGLSEMVSTCATELERKGLSVKRFWFDTRVYPTERNRWHGGGGTDFNCVINHAEKENNVDFYLVITDGFSCEVCARQPRKWLWLITDGGTNHAISKMPNKSINWAFRRQKV